MKVAKKLTPYVVIAIATTIWFYIILDFYNWDIHVPISYYGDTITDGGTLTLAEKAIRGDGILSLKGFWNVDDSTTAWGIVDASIHYIIMRFLTVIFFIGSPGTLANVYFILTFALCGCFMFYTLKRLDVNIYLAMAVGIVYSFVPGHLQRSIEHLAIGSCFALPLLVLGCVYIIFDAESFEKEKVLIRIRKIEIDRKVIEGVAGALLVGFLSIYYCAFAMIVHTICIFLCFLNKRIENAKKGFVLLIADLLPIFFNVVLPNIISAGNAVASFGNTRQISDINVYGMKIIQLIMPIAGHRIPFMAALRTKYSTSFAENENAFSSLGLLLSLALIISIVLAFKDKKTKITDNNIAQIGKVNILILLISIVGGIAELIGLLISFIRCYNRMSYFIACFCCIVISVLLNIWISKRKIIIQILMSLIIMTFAILDQTSAEWKYSKEYADTSAEGWYNENTFFDSIEATGADEVLIYPSKYSSSYQSDPIYTYETMKSYIYTDEDILFTTGYLEGSDTDLWIKGLENYSDDEKLKIMAVKGFDGILLYKNGFSDEQYFKEFYNSVLSLCDSVNVITSADGLWYYIPLASKYKNELEKWDVEELDSACDLIGSNNFELERTYKFGISEIEPFIIEGFSRSENDFRWSLGEESIINFAINEVAFGNLDVNLEYLDLMGVQSIKINVNGQDILERTLTGGSGTVSFTIPRDIIVDNNVEISIRYSNAISPASQGISNDLRNLAVAWDNMTITDSGNDIKENNSYIDRSILDKYLGR